MSASIIVYQFRYRDEIRGKMITSRYKLSRDEIEAKHPSAEIVEASAELRQVFEQDEFGQLSAGHIVARRPGFEDDGK